MSWCKTSNIFSKFRNFLFHTALIMCWKFTRASLVKFTMMEHWFSINRLLCMDIHLRLWILWKNLPLTLEIWYSALIWWECSTDTLGIFCCVCLPYHLILCYIIYYIWNKLCKGCSSIGKLVFILFRISVWGIEPISSTCLGHLHLKKIVQIIKFIIAGTLVLEKVCLNYEIQLAWDIFDFISEMFFNFF